MSKILYFLFFCLSQIISYGQLISDSVSMQSLYSNQVFYSLDNGEVANINNNDWDLGFAVIGNGAAGSAIILNEATTSLWAYPSDTADWNSFDTTNHQNWEQLLNSDTSWTNGAFNKHRGAAGMFDMGWGILNPQNNYWTFGDSLYLVKLSDNSYRKLWIVSLKSGVWEFKYANINGTNEQSFTIDKSNYTNRNFVYHSMVTNTTIDREPDNTTWDLMFAKHTDYVNPPGTYVSVTSVFNNRDVWSAKAHETDYNTASTSTTPQTAFNQNITNIGREWKKYSSQSGWTVYDSIAYFVYDNDSTDFYRLVFTGFGGMSTGKTYFVKELINSVSVKSFSNNTVNIGLYPNPNHGNLTLLIDYNSSEKLIVNLTNLSGKQVFSKEININQGVNQKLLNINRLPSGIYLVNVLGKSFNTTQKLVLH